MKNHKLFSPVLPLVLCMLMSCNKNNEGNTQLKVRLTDAPFDAQEVNVDIREVRVNFAKDTLGWVPLQTNAKVYNLLGLQNGVDTLLATSSVPAGTVQELRLILGTNNSIKIKDVSYPLSVASADESGLKIKVGKQLRTGVDSMLVDFDAGLSIIQTGTGTYKLKPVLKLK